MYRIMNKGIPNNRAHHVCADEVLMGGRNISKTRTENGLTHMGVTSIEPDGRIVHVTDKLGAVLEKCPEILVVEKIEDAPKGK